MRGGIVQRIGGALFEECIYDDARLLTNGSFADYLMPMAAEKRDIVVAHVETATLISQLGAKALGNLGLLAPRRCHECHQ